jgi:hypothetical protein
VGYFKGYLSALLTDGIQKIMLVTVDECGSVELRAELDFDESRPLECKLPDSKADFCWKLLK